MPISLCLLCYVLPQHWKYDESSDTHYLDSEGFGAGIWGVFLLVFPLVYIGFKEPSNETLKLPQPDLSDAVSPEDLKLVFGKVPSYMRILDFLVILVRFAGNIAFISYNFLNLPPRDPNERLNQAKHIVTWVEFPVAMLMAFLSVTGLLGWIVGKKVCGMWLCKILKGTGQFSVLLCLPLANPMKMIDRMNKTRKRIFIFFGLVYILFVPTSILSIMIKVAQVDFITEKIYWDWTIWNWFAFAGFINNLAGLVPDNVFIQIDAIFRFITANNPAESRIRWLRALGDALRKQYGWRGLILMSSLKAEDVGILLNKSIRPESLVPQ